MNYRNLHQMNLYDVFGESPWVQEDFLPTDREYMKRMCTKTGRELMPYIEDVCDAKEYDGSCMYDEYPDIMAEEVYEQAGHPEPEEWVKALIQSMLYNEICYRRRRRRDFKQQLYGR